MVVRLGERDATAALSGILAGGGVVIMPCDTIYGIVGIAPATEARISRIKKREPGKPFLRLIGDGSWLPRYTAVTLPEPLRRFWPGPLTVVFPDRHGGTVALRVPEDAWLRALLTALDLPLASTSVNVEGEPPLGGIAEIVLRFGSTVDLVVDGGDRIGTVPSTLIDVTVSPYRVLRQGSVRIPDELTRIT